MQPGSCTFDTHTMVSATVGHRCALSRFTHDRPKHMRDENVEHTVSSQSHTVEFHRVVKISLFLFFSPLNIIFGWFERVRSVLVFFLLFSSHSVSSAVCVRKCITHYSFTSVLEFFVFMCLVDRHHPPSKTTNAPKSTKIVFSVSQQNSKKKNNK